MAGILSVQLNSKPNDKEYNLSKIKSFIDKYKDRNLDLILLPEFFSTNIEYQSSFEDENGGKTIKSICELAKKYNTNIVAGTVVRKEKDKFYNTSFAINRCGEILAKYDKIHLYNYLGGNEGSFTSAGDKIITVNFDFARVGLAICFDIRYPLHFNKLIKQKVDIITLPTAWIIPKEVYEHNFQMAKDMWISLLRTRAYDNMVYFIVSNQTGFAQNNLYGLGNSMILSPTSEILAHIDKEEGAIYSEIDISNTDFMRKIFPIYKID